MKSVHAGSDTTQNSMDKSQRECLVGGARHLRICSDLSIHMNCENNLNSPTELIVQVVVIFDC